MLKKLNTSKIPELHFFSQWLVENKSDFEDILNKYLSLLKSITKLKDKDISSINDAKIEIWDMKLEYFNASEFDVVPFLRSVSSDRKFFEKIFYDIFSPNSEVVSNLQTLLENGSQIASNISTNPIDWDAAWDGVIWWHTQLVHTATETVLIHFLISHYISQYIKLKLWDTYWFTQKDDFLLVMTDILMYNPKNQQIFDVWCLPKSHWWLWWINPDHIKYFI